ncbi:putative parathyroid hormone 2 receptor [Trichinella spiralis]|uniref:putative parathyroid hormone 2 receptor n=1 Tax=Trichinella spiralis TaxID=6334 RepID=UPI0001EFCC38|nr:putative parathyroid hormone 2 receptor [Trichinella spiralis]
MAGKMHTKFSGQIEKSSKSQCENGQLLKSTHGKLSCHAAVYDIANYFVAVRQLQKKFDRQNHIMNLQDFASCDKICDAENGCALKDWLYTGRSGEQRQIGLANTIVEQLAQPFLNPNRNAFMDRYFTSFSTVEYFPEHGLRAVDTVSAHHRDVPARLRETARH